MVATEGALLGHKETEQGSASQLRAGADRLRQGSHTHLQGPSLRAHTSQPCSGLSAGIPSAGQALPTQHQNLSALLLQHPCRRSVSSTLFLFLTFI